MTSRSRQRGRIFSIPTTETRTSGSVVHMRPLPSDSRTTTCPVSATAKFAPLTPTGTERNFARRCARAAAVNSAGSSETSTPNSRRKSAAIWARLRWMAGTRMCEDVSPASWLMSSARSVSTACTPTASRRSLRSISSVASDLTLMTSSEPWARATSATTAAASAPSRAQCTVPPARWTVSSRRSRWTSRWRSARSLISAPASRRASQSGTSPTTRARLSRIVVVAWPRLRRSWLSASAARAARGKPSFTRPPWPGSRPGASRARPRASGAARRRCASGTSCQPRHRRRPRCR